jgi:hypothetical protein
MTVYAVAKLGYLAYRIYKILKGSGAADSPGDDQTGGDDIADGFTHDPSDWL